LNAQAGLWFKQCAMRGAADENRFTVHEIIWLPVERYGQMRAAIQVSGNFKLGQACDQDTAGTNDKPASGANGDVIKFA
jgi:hypothetical protein